jgi:hypothetical protein
MGIYGFNIMMIPSSEVAKHQDLFENEHVIASSLHQGAHFLMYL